jgi:hypothetical protein
LEQEPKRANLIEIQNAIEGKSRASRVTIAASNDRLPAIVDFNIRL